MSASLDGLRLDDGGVAVEVALAGLEDHGLDLGSFLASLVVVLVLVLAPALLLVGRYLARSVVGVHELASVYTNISTCNDREQGTGVVDLLGMMKNETSCGVETGSDGVCQLELGVVDSSFDTFFWMVERTRWSIHFS